MSRSRAGGEVEGRRMCLVLDGKTLSWNVLQDEGRGGTVAGGRLRATSFLYQIIFSKSNRIILSCLVSTEDDDQVHRLLCFFQTILSHFRINLCNRDVNMFSLPLVPSTAWSVPLVQELP